LHVLAIRQGEATHAKLSQISHTAWNWRNIAIAPDEEAPCAPFPRGGGVHHSMPKTKKRKKAHKRGRKASSGGIDGYVLDQLYAVIDGHKDADPDTSYTARLFSRGRQQIAKKLGEEAVEAFIEGIRGNRPKLVGESADMLYHLLTLWSATNVKPTAVWAELARREGLSGRVRKATRKA